MNTSSESIAALPEGDWRMRTGEHLFPDLDKEQRQQLGRNLYLQWPDGRHELVGQVDTILLAIYITECVNNWRDLSPSPAATFHNIIGGDVDTHVQGTHITVTDL